MTSLDQSIHEMLALLICMWLCALATHVLLCKQMMHSLYIPCSQKVIQLDNHNGSQIGTDNWHNLKCTALSDLETNVKKYGTLLLPKLSSEAETQVIEG